MQAELLDEAVDLARRDAVDVGLLDDRDQGLFGAPARLEDRRHEAALAQLGDGQLDRPDARVPLTRAVAVALRGAPLRGALAVGGADLLAHLGLDELGDQPRHALAQHVGVLGRHQLVDQLGSGHPLALGHRGALLRRTARTDRRFEAPGGRPSSGTASSSSYTTSTDSTRAGRVSGRRGDPAGARGGSRGVPRRDAAWSGAPRGSGPWSAPAPGG